ncbi:GTPase IMAP family member 8-like [Neosynchiropus ocellatus]
MLTDFPFTAPLSRGPPPQSPAVGKKIAEYTIVLLGRSGTGKSASANTILKAGGSKTTTLFRSEPSSVPVTRQCEVKFTHFGIPVRVVDTPDFFSNELRNMEQQIAQCREFCRSEPCTFLLVFQLGRFSENEAGLLDRFENTLGMRIRDRTIILLTHGEDLEGPLGSYLVAYPPLLGMVQQCQNRCHLFNNHSKDRDQVESPGGALHRTPPRTPKKAGQSFAPPKPKSQGGDPLVNRGENSNTQALRRGPVSPHLPGTSHHEQHRRMKESSPYPGAGFQSPSYALSWWARGMKKKMYPPRSCFGLNPAGLRGSPSHQALAGGPNTQAWLQLRDARKFNVIIKGVGSRTYPKFLSVAVLGTPAQLKCNVGNQILHDERAFVATGNHLTQSRNRTFKVINTPDFFDEDSKYPDQQIIDFMAISYPGPDLFILVVDPAEAAEERVVAQITKLGDLFGDSVLPYVTVLLQDAEHFYALRHLMDRLNICVAVNKENLASDCQRWCCDRNSFLYQYNNYAEGVVKRRKESLEIRRYRYSAGNPPPTLRMPSSSKDTLQRRQKPVHPLYETITGPWTKQYTIVLLGRSGTGKSASANTILKAAGSKTTTLFRSEPSSVPVTRQCEVKFTHFGIPVRVVDTPDFFSDQLPNMEQQIAECREFCRSEPCTFLLVFQLGRFSKNEAGLLDRFENTLGIRIRDRTIILLTHGEDLEGSLGSYLVAYPPLLGMVQQCQNRCHLFNNNSKDCDQVKKLLKMIPNYQAIFQNIGKKDDCYLS